ncbi:hypothetical protein [Sphingobium sp. EM0848]|uniref:hypothetical protein n=1 Tax=Sphingobium sp. EM0848 TaxID=2743473 RepID=UPI00159C9C37|nr:hypothetical protein [Sphingobium sp. EM0848]
MTGLGFAGFSLPMSSELSAVEVAAFYREHLTGIRIAGTFFLFCAAFMMLFAAAISAQLQRIEGRVTPWVFVQIMGGVMGNLPFALTGIIWSAAAFRPDRPPEILQAMNDIAVLALELPAPTAIIQFLGIIFVVLGDRSPNPIFPKWVAYLNIIVAILFLPGFAGGIFVTSKAMDWNGFLSYSMPGMASSTWVLLMSVALMRAVHRTAEHNDR